MMTKYLFLAIALTGCSVAASAQASLPMNVMNAQTTMLVMQEHPQHASQTGMAREENILEHSEPVVERGERPLWEVMPPPAFVCLGDAARSFKTEHLSAKRASVVWHNY